MVGPGRCSDFWFALLPAPSHLVGRESLLVFVNAEEKFSCDND